MKKVNEVHRSETWIVDLDSKKVRTHGSVFTLSEQADICLLLPHMQINAPSLPDKPLLEFPFSILQLQADIRRVSS